jgi:hypothetical protein
MAFFDYMDLKFQQLTTQVNNYLSDVYSRSSEIFSNASPFGQIISFLKNIYQFNILYQKNIVKNIMIDEADSQKSVRNLARIGGHNPTRSISATGILLLKLKPNIDITSDIGGGQIKVSDKIKIKNKTNGLIYTIRTVKSEDVYQVSQTADIYLNLIQGTYESQSYTGTGEINQSFSINIPVSNTIDNFEISVTYNNQSVTIRNSMYDMFANEIACFTRTGMNGGVDIFFGNSAFGFVPAVGTLITVTYLLTDGTNGIILSPQINDFQFLDDIVDMNGQQVNIDNTFDVSIQNTIDFASDGETTSFTKAIMPYISRNFVLATPNQYIFTLKRLNMFSQINVYTSLSDTNFENDNKIFLFLVPNISNFFNGNVNYFNLPTSAFFLSTDNQTKVITYLRKMGNITVNTVLEIIQPTISLYVMNIYVQTFNGYSDDTIKNNIITQISSYLGNLQRTDRIPKSDIISVVESITGVDSVNVSFISKKNEDYQKLNPGSTAIFGLDPILGDIIVNTNELFIIRGGWSDSNYTYYNEILNGDSLGPINIIFIGTTIKNTNN